MRSAPEIPVGHVAFRVEHVERVVGHALHQQPELLFALPETPFRRLALGQIARDLGESDDLPVRRTDRIDDHMGPEPAAVLADAPAFAFEPAFARGGLQRARGKPGLAILIGIEAGKMAADDLRRRS